MRILLVVPTHHYSTEYPKFLSVSDFPSGIAYIAASLGDAGHQVYGLNLNNIIGYASAYDMIKDNIEYALKQVNPELIGLSGICIDFKFLRDAIQIIRDNSKAIIVLGGGIVTNDAEFIMNTLEPDICVKGDGEEIMVRIANGDKLEDIDNIGYWVE